jgi:hypothetical protein
MWMHVKMKEVDGRLMRMDEMMKMVIWSPSLFSK